MRITIGGCRTYNNYIALKITLDKIIPEICKNTEVVILSGHCKGVDLLVEQYALKNGYEVEIHEAQWSKYGKFAGPIRNEIMVRNSDFIIAFWDGNSRGTKNLIELAKKHNKPFIIERIKPPE